MHIDQRVEIVGDVDRELATQRKIALAVLAAAGQQVVDIAVRVGSRPGDAETDAVGNRTADRRLAGDRVERAVGKRSLGLEIPARLCRDEVDRAAGGIAAIERSLRPLEDLDALEV